MAKLQKELTPEQIIELNDQEKRCVKAARDIFKLLGEEADNLPMGDEVTPEISQKIMVPIVDKIADILISNNLRAKSDFNLVNQYMKQPMSEYEWRTTQFIEGFKQALVESIVGETYDSMTVLQLKEAIAKTFPQKKVEA